jgi:hypothetical protein
VTFFLKQLEILKNIDIIKLVARLV